MHRILIHGALGSASQLAPLASRLGDAVLCVELAGHGDTPSTDAAYDIRAFAADVLRAMDARGIARASLFGYSMGGYVALVLAADHPGRVDSVATLGTKLAWSPDVARRETSRLDPDAIRAKVPNFAELLERRHAGAGGWEGVLHRTSALLRGLGDAPIVDDALLARIQQPVRLMVGDRDTVVSIDETAAAAKKLTRGELAVLPGTPHPIEQADVALLAALLPR